MNTSGPVLRDIHVPTAAWWPPAPGWWLLAALIVLLLAGAAWWIGRRARRRPLAATLREIDALALAHAHDGDVARLVDGASRLLRRIACRIAPAVASRDGEAWRDFVRLHATDDTARRVLDGLVDARFHAQPVVDPSALTTALRGWCRHALRGGVRPTRLAKRVMPT